jgi:hypothetical protein
LTSLHFGHRLAAMAHPIAAAADLDARSRDAVAAGDRMLTRRPAERRGHPAIATTEETTTRSSPCRSH